jgi:cell division septal protein FtsQ
MIGMRLGRPGRQRPERRDAVLNVRSLSRGRGSDLSKQATKAGLVALFALAGLAGLALGAYGLGRLLFARNDRFRITALDIRDDGNIATHFIRNMKHIREGTNLFSFSAARVRQEFMEQRYASKYRSMEISRVLPGTLVVSVTERVPAARIGPETGLVVDREGCVFGLRQGGRSLPAITGYPSVDLKPGTRLDRQAVAALQALEACDDPRLGIGVDSVDVEEDAYLVVTLKPGSPAKGFKLSWKGMGERTERSLDDLRVQLKRVSQALRQPGDRRHTMLDATYGSRIYGSP